MPKYYRIFTNCSKKSNKAIANIPVGEIVHESCSPFYLGGRKHWRDERTCLVKVKDFREFYELYKWLKVNCGYFEFSQQSKVGITEKPIEEFVRPISFDSVDHSKLRNIMTRTYHWPSRREDDPPWIREHRGTDRNEVFVVDNLSDVLSGNLDILNEARNASCQ